MSRELIIKKIARVETAEAYDWYEQKRRGLGDEFLGAVEAVLAVIQRTPERFPAVEGPARKARLRRFPYAVHYIVRDNLISVLAVFHAKRDPQILLERLRDIEN